MCPKHGPPRRFPNLPFGDRAQCHECWKAYARKAEGVLKVRPRGGVKGGGGQGSKRKGRQAVVEVATLLAKSLGLPAEDIFVKATSQAGTDLHLSPRARYAFPYAVEVKCQEALNIWQAIRQAEANAGGLCPIVVFRRAQTPFHVVIGAESFLDLVRRLALADRPKESGRGPEVPEEKAR